MAGTEIKVQMQQRRDTAAGWTSADPTLLSGEFGYETDTGKLKIGDGSTAWSSLAYEPGFSLSSYPLSASDLADDAVVREWTLTANGTTDYIFAGPGFAGTETDPDLYVVRGQTYKFTNSMGAHPFQIQSTQGTSGTAYNDGITNNAVSNGTLTWEVRMDAPSTLYYQCTSHALMAGVIYVLDEGGSVASIDDLGDVDTSTVAPTDGQALLWDNTAQKWEPGTVSGGGTTLPSAQDGEALIYENGAWVAGPVIGGVDYTGSGGDSNFSSVELLALFNGTDGSQTFTDSSSVGHTLTATGNSSTVKISTTESKFGGSSAFFNFGYVSLSSRIEFQSDPFTVEAWIYPTVADQGSVFSNRDSGNGMELIRLSNGTIMFHHGNVANSIITTTTTSLNTWSHIAVTRDSNDLFTVWINGVDSGNDTFAGVSLGAGHANPKIARQASSAAQYYRGYIDDLRVTNGVCRYTADFTAPTAELPSSAPPQITIPYSIDKLDDVDTSTVAPTDGTTLIYENGTYIPGPVIGGVNYNSGDSDFSSVAALFHFNGTNGSTTFTDSGPDGLSMTASGSASISTAQSKFGGASGLFPGGSHITFPATIPFNSDPFTVECWVYPTTLDGNNIYSARTSGSGITFRLLSNGELNFFYGHGTSAFQTTAGVSLNTWSHVAVTRDSNNLFTLWIDGVSSATSTITASMGTGATPVIGKAASFGGEYFKGYIDELRVTKGVCRYTANFTPPTAELADISSQVTITAADSIRTLLGIDEYADDTAAGTGGLSSGELYYNTTSSSYVLKT